MQVLERLVPAAMHGLWSMLLLGPAVRDAEARDAEHGWDLVFRGKEIRKDALVKRLPRHTRTATHCVLLDPDPMHPCCSVGCCLCLACCTSLQSILPQLLLPPSEFP